MKPWTTLDLEALRYLGPRLGGPETARALQRSLASVQVQAHRYQIKLSRLPILESHTKALTPEGLHQRIQQLASAPLCPSCGMRPASVPATGLCVKCHCDTRVALSEEETARVEGERRRWAARSKLQRRRRELAKEFPYFWRVRTHLPERFGKRCAVLCRGSMNSCAVEFEDGYRVVTSRWYVRKAPVGATEAKEPKP